MRAHVGDRGHTLALAKNESANPAGRDQLALALIEIGKRTDVRPAAVPGQHGTRCRAQSRTWGGLEPAADDSARQRASGHAKSRDQCGAPSQPRLLGCGLEYLSEPVPEGRAHPLRALAGGRKLRGCRDRLLLFGIARSQPQAAAAKEVGDDAIDPILWLVTHPG